jgi:hypothetical protein
MAKKEKEEQKKDDLDYIGEEDTMDIGETLLSWQMPEFAKHEKSKKWYLYFGILIVALLAYAYFSSNILFAVIIIFFTIMYWLLEKRDIAELDFAIAEDGIVIGHKFIEWTSIANFYLIYQPPRIKNLYFRPKNNIKQLIIIPLLDENPVEVRKALLEFLPEDLEQEEISGLESVGEIFKL